MQHKASKQNVEQKLYSDFISLHGVDPIDAEVEIHGRHDNMLLHPETLS